MSPTIGRLLLGTKKLEQMMVWENGESCMKREFIPPKAPTCLAQPARDESALGASEGDGREIVLNGA